MSASELRYLRAAVELYDGGGGVRLTEIAAKLLVTKASAYRAVERLESFGLVERGDKSRIRPTIQGKAVAKEYRDCISFIQGALERHCCTPSRVAFEDALCTLCAISDGTRQALVRYLKEGRKA